MNENITTTDSIYSSKQTKPSFETKVICNVVKRETLLGKDYNSLLKYFLSISVVLHALIVMNMNSA